MCTIREQHSPNAAINPPKEKWNRKSLGVTNVLSFCVGTAQTQPWEPQQHLVHRFAMRSNPSYLEMQIKQTMLFLNINDASYQLLFIRLLFSSRVGCACGVMQPSNPHAYCSLRSQGNRTGTQTSLPSKACLYHDILLKAMNHNSIWLYIFALLKPKYFQLLTTFYNITSTRKLTTYYAAYLA